MRDFDDYLMESYEMREKLVADKFRPRYHFAPPEGRWNDINGAVFWKGRYHIGYLQKIANGPGERDFSSWQHISSRDLSSTGVTTRRRCGSRWRARRAIISTAAT